VKIAISKASLQSGFFETRVLTDITLNNNTVSNITQDIEECSEAAEVSQLQPTCQSSLSRLRDYHQKLAAYYDPSQASDLKSHMLPIDVQNPQFTFEFAKEFQESMQRED